MELRDGKRSKTTCLNDPPYSTPPTHTDFSPEEKMGKETPSSNPNSSHYHSYQNGKRNLLE